MTPRVSVALLLTDGHTRANDTMRDDQRTASMGSSVSEDAEKQAVSISEDVKEEEPSAYVVDPEAEKRYVVRCCCRAPVDCWLT